MKVYLHEAQELWCPFSRLYEPDERGGATSTNRPALNENDDVRSPLRCIGHKCMAWRWFSEEAHGYCGLAGKPEDA